MDNTSGTDYYSQYITYKKKYLALKKQIALKQMQQGGNRQRYLQYGPTDSYVIDSDRYEMGMNRMPQMQQMQQMQTRQMPVKQPVNNGINLDFGNFFDLMKTEESDDM